jgi:hypothetical protein
MCINKVRHVASGSVKYGLMFLVSICGRRLRRCLYIVNVTVVTCYRRCGDRFQHQFLVFIVRVHYSSVHMATPPLSVYCEGRYRNVPYIQQILISPQASLFFCFPRLLAVVNHILYIVFRFRSKCVCNCIVTCDVMWIRVR